MKINVDDLQGDALDWAVATFEKPQYLHTIWLERNWHPSSNWEQGGVLMHENRIGVWFGSEEIDPDTGHIVSELWFAEADELLADGPTPLIAAMRVFVKLCMAEEDKEPFVIEVPDNVANRSAK